MNNPLSNTTLKVLSLILSLGISFSANAAVKADRIFAFASDATLATGDRLFSGNLDYVVTMQGDCNLVLYTNPLGGTGNQLGQALWSSRTNGRGTNCRAVMQEDGNFVVYTGQNRAVWASNSVNHDPRSLLVMQNDGNLVIYTNGQENSNPTFATNTVQQ